MDPAAMYARYSVCQSLWLTIFEILTTTPMPRPSWTIFNAIPNGALTISGLL